MNRTDAKAIADKHPGLAADFLMRYVEGRETLEWTVNALVMLYELTEAKKIELEARNEFLMEGIKKAKQMDEELLACIKQNVNYALTKQSNKSIITHRM